MRRTKIVCTLGPATENISVIKDLIRTGMDAARINFSHGSYESHKVMIEKLKAACEEMNAPIPLILDTKGPEIRLKSFEKGKVYLNKGDTFTLTTKDVPGNQSKVSVTYENMPQDLEVGKKVLLDDGLIELTVKEIFETDIVCTVENNGEISDNKGVNVPDVHLKLPALTEKDKSDLLFGIENDFDFVAASFIRSAKDVMKIRDVLIENGGAHIKIIAKIENREGVDNIDAILHEADGIMVARGDLGVEIPPEEVPLVQKMLIKKANQTGRFVITATQMLESMIENPRPTRAEANDVANSIYDSTDAIMLSGETAKGRYPVKAVDMMARISIKVEADISYDKRLKFRTVPANSITNAIGHGAASMAVELDTACIATVTHSGFTPRMVSRFRPVCPIIACTMYKKVWRQMNLIWGCKPIYNDAAEKTNDEFEVAMDAAISSGLVKPGDMVIMTMGIPVGVAGSTNTLRIGIAH